MQDLIFSESEKANLKSSGISGLFFLALKPKASQIAHGSRNLARSGKPGI